MVVGLGQLVMVVNNIMVCHLIMIMVCSYIMVVNMGMAVHVHAWHHST